MTPAEIEEEVRYRTNERLAVMGFYDPKTTPEWARVQAEKEAKDAIKQIAGKKDK